MSHKYSENAQATNDVFNKVHKLPDWQSELHTVWASQLVRKKEIVDSDYNRAHPLEFTFFQNFSTTH